MNNEYPRYNTKPSTRAKQPPARVTIIIGRDLADTLLRLCPTPAQREAFILRAIYNEIKKVSQS